MTIYRYTSPSPIERVTFVANEDGSRRAYLEAAPSVSHEALAQMALALERRGFQNEANEIDGRPALLVRGFGWEKSLTEFLQEKRWVQGEPAIEKNDEKKASWWETVKKRSLFTSGLFYIIGDAKFISYGYKGSSPLNIAGGVFYGMGTLANLMFSRRSNVDLQVQDMAQLMADHLNKMNVAIPDDVALHRITDKQHDGKLKTADDYFRHYPSELFNLFTSMAGACIAAAAIKQLGKKELPPKMVPEFMKRQAARGVANPLSHEQAHAMLHKWHHRANWLDVGLGGLTMLSCGFGGLVKEKARDPDAPQKEGLEGWWEWMRERPLTITGAGLMVSTMCHAVSTAIEYRIGTTDAKSAIFDRGMFIASNLIAEFLVAISSKGHGEGVRTDGTVDESAVAIAAELIARQPQEYRPQLTQYMAQFLGRPDVLAMKDEDALHKLEHAVAAMGNNPWAQKTTGRAPAASHASRHTALFGASASPAQLSL